MRNRFFELISRFGKRSVLVVGDLMLDEWIWGKVSRISPEAPVPVVQVEKRTFSPGGASNVAANVRSLGARTILSGLVGADHPGRILRRKLRDCGVELEGLISVKGRPTIMKTRIIAHSQQVVRADVEAKGILNGRVMQKANRLLEGLVDETDLVLFSDYNKGFLASVPVPDLIRHAVRKKKKIVAGPKPVNLPLFSGSDLVVLNQSEAEQAAGLEIQNDSGLEKAGKVLLERLRLGSLIITRGEHGMSLFRPGEKTISIPSKASQVYDVSGAGDTVVAVAALALASGATPQEAAVLSNHAAGVVVQKLGTATVTRDELKETFHE